MSAQVFLLPDLGEGLTEAEVVEWLVAVGDEVEIDQNVVTVETAKATVEVPVPFAGTVSALHGEVGQVMEVGRPLISVGGAGDDAGSDGSGEGAQGADAPGDSGSDPRAGHQQYRTEEQAGVEVPAEGGATQDEGSGAVLIGFGTGHGGSTRRRRTPRGAAATSSPSPISSPDATESARHAASTPQKGTSGDQIGKRDGDAAQAPRLSDERIPLTGVMRMMTERLTASRSEIPDATTWVDADATKLLRAKDALKAARPDAGIGVLPLMARIVVVGLHRHPALNASVEMQDGTAVAVQRHARINLGFAAQSPRGLVVPVVHDAGSMTTTELAAALRELTGLAREGRLSPAQLTGGTFTLNNYGVFGVDGSTPIINHPEAAMLGVGRIVERPWAVHGKLKVRKVTQLGFTFDHRVCDGGTAGGFLRFVADCVEDPALLLAEL
ncbi:dihydrolipoamide acetyltransferase family protein [Kytococcus sp. Marseille-QA3725]